jgi:hypothetical protein
MSHKAVLQLQLRNCSMRELRCWGALCVTAQGVRHARLPACNTSAAKKCARGPCCPGTSRCCPGTSRCVKAIHFQHYPNVVSVHMHGVTFFAHNSLHPPAHPARARANFNPVASAMPRTQCCTLHCRALDGRFGSRFSRKRGAKERADERGGSTSVRYSRDLGTQCVWRFVHSRTRETSVEDKRWQSYLR